MFLHFSCYGKELLHNFLKFLSFSFLSFFTEVLREVTNLLLLMLNVVFAY